MTCTGTKGFGDKTYPAEEEIVYFHIFARRHFVTLLQISGNLATFAPVWQQSTDSLTHWVDQCNLDSMSLITQWVIDWLTM